jgi:argininosuccinate synthase
MKKKAILAYSGGLDTSFCAVYLSRDLDLEVHTVIVNSGGFTARSYCREARLRAGLGEARGN